MRKVMAESTFSIFIDGASRGNPGIASVGISILDNHGEEIIAQGYKIGIATNNQAEYCALLCALEIYQKEVGIPGAHLKIFADSQLLVYQLTGRYKVKNPTIRKIFDEASIVLKSFSRTIQHVPREKNKRADELANQGIDLDNTLPPYLDLKVKKVLSPTN